MLKRKPCTFLMSGIGHHLTARKNTAHGGVREMTPYTEYLFCAGIAT